jgi:TatD DNase family protein
MKLGSDTLVDFHCHLDLLPDFERRVLDSDIQRIATLAVTTSPKAWPRNQELCSRTRLVQAALGLHPQITEQRQQEVEIIQQYLSRAKYVGEVGIDGRHPWIKTIELQRQIFARILSICAETGKNVVLSIHSARAVQPVLDCLKPFLCPSTRLYAVLHWFTGTASQAKEASRMGLYFSINPRMTQTRSGRETIKCIPSDRLLTETDCPFAIAPDSRREALLNTIRDIATIRSVDDDSVADLIRCNFHALTNHVEK